MDIRLLYGKDGLDIQLPEDIDVEIIEPKFEKGLDDQIGEVRKALREPTGTAPLSELVGPEDTVGIIFSDITRATPYDILLPAIFAELPHVRKDQYVLCNPIGTHRSNTKEELESILGPGIVGSYKIVQNDCDDEEAHRFVGKSSGGNEVYILSEFLDCDVRILTGFIEPHFFAGYSGGGKAVMPGLATLKTIQYNHRAMHMDHPQARWGITSGNPLWEEVREAASFAKPSFLLNIALNKDKEVTAAFAGDYVEAHGLGCEYVKEHAMSPVSEPFDLVITSNSGYPLDLNMYQAVKGMSAASQIVKEGGDIIIAADCWDGIPAHGQYGRLLSEAKTLDELLSRIREPGFAMQDMWQAQIHALICKKAQVHFYSENLSDEEIENGFMRPCRDIGERVKELSSKAGKKFRVCVLPEGPQTIPYLSD